MAILLLFIVQSAWLALSAIYPLPFDEFAHVGAIQLYAEQWSPFMAQQPLDSGIIGDITREPSVLYRWLMSYPYRVLETASLSQDHIIVVLRLLNVAMVTGGIILFRKLLIEWGLSKRLVHVVLLAFAVTPIVPFLAAHVNYDNMMFLLAPLVFLYASRIIKGNKEFIPNVALFVLTGAAATLVKQTFLPLMVIVTVYVVAAVWRRTHGRTMAILEKSWRQTPKNLAFLLVLTGLIALGAIAVERYGGNVITYGTFRPDCEQVQPVEFCENFGPWYRNNVINAENRPEQPPYGNPLSFSQYWATRMMRGYFALFAHTPTQVVSEREPYGPIVVKPLLPLPISVAYSVAVVGAFFVWRQRKRIWNNPYLRFALCTTVFYVLVLWLFNYNSYLKMWKAEAIQARYTYPVLIVMYALIAQSVSWSIISKRVKVALVLSLVLLYVWSGGIVGWLIRADDTWRWQSNRVQHINQNIQRTLKHIVIH